MRLGALGVILACIAARVSVSFEPVPYWDGDPTVLWAPSSAMGPTVSIVLDLVILLASVVGFASVGRSVRPSLYEATLVFAPAIALWKHLGTSVEDARLGSAWLGAMVGALAVKSLCSDARLRRVAMAALAALPLVLAAKGASQVFVEHTQTVTAFEQNKEQFLAAQGWTQDSPSARAFERRLRQAEATGWFGLSNVYASFAAFGVVVFGGLSFAFRGAQRGLWVMLPLGALGCSGALLLAHSKGGAGAAGIGVGMLAVGMLARRRMAGGARCRRIGAALGVGVMAAVLLGVGLRGVIGEKLGELSLLFRWFYMQGAARAFAEHPVWGVGPAGFKDAYMMVKPVLSPEEVTSPHSVMFDYAATLGVFGLVWCAWLVWLAARSGIAVVCGELSGAAVEREGADRGIERRVLFLVCAFATVVGAYAERDAATPEAALFRVGGMVLGTLGAIGVRDVLAKAGGIGWVFAAGALAVAAHVQIEVTAVWPNACAWVAATLACGATVGAGKLSQESHTGARPWAAVAGVVALLVVSVRLPAIGAWETNLHRAAAEVRASAELRARLDAIASGLARGDSAKDLAEELSRLEGRPIGDTIPAMRRAVEGLQEAACGGALLRLIEGAERYPDAGQTLRAAARLAIQLSSFKEGRGERDAASDEAARAEALARRACELERSRGASYSWLGTLLVARAEVLGDTAALARAAEAWERSALFDPYGINSPVKLAEVYGRLGDREKAARWAKRALERDGELRLDPLVGLSAAQRAELMKVADGS